MLTYLCVVLSLLSLSFGQDPIAKEVLSCMDWTVDPCENFYQFACGSWIKNTVLPSNKNRLDRSFSTIQTNNEDVLQAIIKNATDPKLSAFYSACMDLDSIDSRGFTPLVPALSIADTITDTQSLMAALAQLKVQGYDVLFGFAGMMDAKEPTVNIGAFDQGGLSLPYPSLYTDDDPNSKDKRTAYLKHLTNMFTLLEDPQPDISAARVFSLELMIASFTLSSDNPAVNDPFLSYNKLTVDDFKALAPNIPWDSYFDILTAHNVTIVGNVTVTVPGFFSNMSVLIPSQKPSWIPYVRWQILRQRAPLLSKAFRDEYFDFWNRILRGQSTPADRSTICIESVDGNLGELLGKYFVEVAFPGTSQKDAENILAGIIGAMNVNLQTVQWMDDTTRQRALEKLTKVTHLIGSPANPDTYSDLTIGAYFFENVQAATTRAVSGSLEQIGHPADKFEWEMTPPTVNAYYDPEKNQMVFPAGILQDPFFNADFPDPMNYGGIGMVQGHELTHGFDNQGSDYDGDGVLENWWEPQTQQKFQEKVQCMINQYSYFQIIPGVFLNGRLTQGENIADNGGIGNAFRAYSALAGNTLNQPSIIANLTNAQLFFIGFGQTWCEKATDDYYRVAVQTDPHSPAPFRILGPLMNLPAFAQHFNCPAGSYMNPTGPCGNTPPTKSCRCSVW